eukprot:3557296-Amphidinium_carterae.1
MDEKHIRKMWWKFVEMDVEKNGFWTNHEVQTSEHILPLVPALDNGLGLLPPMGYNTWNDLGCRSLTEETVRAAADALVSNGLSEKGYVYINVDDCWHADHRNNQS